MPKYTVQDTQTGKNITFDWQGEQQPTDADMEQIFAAAKEFKPAEVQAPSDKNIFRQAAEKVAPYTRPALEIGGALVGGAVGAGAGAAAGGMGVIPGGIVGSGLGLATGKQAQNALEEFGGIKQPSNIPQALASTGKGFVEGVGMELGGPIIGKAAQFAGKLLPTAKPIEQVIKKGIEKGIRPPVSGKRMYSESQKYFSKADDAVRAIVGNKENLNLIDDMGQRTGKLPQSLQEFSQAIEQTKKKVFEKYDALAMQVAGKRPQVSLQAIANQLRPIIENKPLNDFAPEAVEHARKSMNALLNRKSYTVLDAQDAITQLNNSLKAFYQNPSYGAASKAAIDSAIANNLRKELDAVISKETGPGYQQLKNTYGALKAIEKDVNHRAVVDARKNIKGLIDFSDIFSGGEVVRGLLTMNPAAIATGATAKAISSFYRHIINPNRIIKKMFEGVEEASTRSATPRGVAMSLAKAASYMPANAAAESAVQGIPGVATALDNALTSNAEAEELPNQVSLNARQRGIEAYTQDNYDEALRQWQVALKEEPNRAKEIIGFINRAKEMQRAKRDFERRNRGRLAMNTERG